MDEIAEVDGDPRELDELELKGDALNSGDIDEDAHGYATSHFSMGSRASPSPRTALASQRSSTVSRRRGRSDGTPRDGYHRECVASAGSDSPASLSIATSVRSGRSASTAATSVDPRGDQELLMLLDVGDRLESTSLDLSLAAKKTKKSLKSLRSIAGFGDLTMLNAANNAVGSLDGVDAFLDLTTLNLSRNHIKRIDPPLFVLVHLISLDLSGNFISHIPRGIVALEVLETLKMSGNNLSALKEVDVLGRLTNLHACSFAGNPFCKLPTYKDYILSKLLSLERLDDSAISDQVRDKSRRRFNEDMFSKDQCLKEADAAHASEQTKLRQMQQALEAENLRLKDELQLKSKLLQNKSRAWSSATEQLLQLQQELAMMNLDRRASVTASQPPVNNLRGDEPDDEAFSNQPEHEASQTRSSGVDSRPPSPQNARDQDANQPTWRHQQRCLSPKASPKRVLVDSACSPFPIRDAAHNKAPLIAPSGHRSPPSSPKKTAEARVKLLETVPMMSPHDELRRSHGDVPLDVDEEDGNPYGDHAFHRSSLRFPTFEDDGACPAYEDATYVLPACFDSPPGDVEPALLPLSPTHRAWERQHHQLISQTSCGQPSRRHHGGAVDDKENLVRQIQALQSCKQSLVSEISKEEQILHDLKRESAGYANHVELLESDLEVLLGLQKATPRPSTASRQREEETIRAKLEMLRTKMHYAEDKEREIEATIVRMTKRVLEDDIQYAKEYGRSVGRSAVGAGPFDKEIFALTHKLQTVIVEKEEIHSEMSRVLNQLRGVAHDSSALPSSTGLSPEALLLIDQQEQVQRVSAENQAIFIDKQKQVDELKRRLRDVQERIKVREELIASLVAELRDVESELAYINEHAPRPSRTHRRAVSLGSEAGALAGISDDAAMSALATPPKATTRSHSTPNAARSPAKVASSPAKQAHTLGANATEPQETIASLVEAAAADMNSQFEEKFRELFSADVLETIKQDILDKLSRELPIGSARGAAPSVIDHEALHAAIAAALETHMQKALHYLDRSVDSAASHSIGTSGNDAPKIPEPDAGRESVGEQQQLKTTINAKERECWDQVDDFMPVEDANYVAKFRFLKTAAATEPSPANALKCSRTAAAQRILKACERLEQAEAECRIDSISSIEVDASGRKKSCLKALVLGARDLPTTHLRTKNLDPYVAVEVVYPDYVLPPAKPRPLSLAAPSLSMGRHVLLDEQTHLPNQSFRSRTVKKSVYPVWDEAFEFAPIHSLKGYVHVRVLNDRKLSREQLVGEVKIPLRLLVEQKKVVETFMLRPGGTGDACGPRKLSGSSRAAPTGGGSIRLQLQLSFSRVDKCKRALDELVAKFLHEYNHLPAFIEDVEQFHARVCGVAEENEAETSPQERALPTFEAWKEQQAQAAESTPTRPPSPAPCKPSDPPATLASTRSQCRARPEPPPKADSSRMAHDADQRRPAARTAKSASVRAAPTSAKAAMAQLRQMVKAHAPPTRQSFELRRRILSSSAPLLTPAAAVRVSPECFDEYSPYHPDFQLLDPLGVDAASCPSFTSAKAARPSPRGYETRTNLRIFKSPGFSRREPSGGFPERFIGLDTQTSERIKRIFGRIDG